MLTRFVRGLFGGVELPSNCLFSSHFFAKPVPPSSFPQVLNGVGFLRFLSKVGKDVVLKLSKCGWLEVSKLVSISSGLSIVKRLGLRAQIGTASPQEIW